MAHIITYKQCEISIADPASNTDPIVVYNQIKHWDTESNNQFELDYLQEQYETSFPDKQITITKQEI